MKKLLARVAAALLALATVAPVLASVPPGQQGYEGQPGNQGGSQHNP